MDARRISPNEYTDLMTSSEIDRYARTRAFWDGHTIGDLRDIEVIKLYNGRLPSRVLDLFPKAEVIAQKNPREPIMRYDNMLLYPQYSGRQRRGRCEDMFDIWLDLCVDHFPEYAQHSIQFESIEFGTRDQTGIQYENDAYDFSQRILKKHPDEVHSLDTIMIGPLKQIKEAWYDGNDGHMWEYTDEYSNYAFMQVGDKTVIGFDYLYGEQAKLVVEKFLRMLGDSTDYQRNLHVVMYGDVGGVNTAMQRGDFIIPTWVCNEDDLDWLEQKQQHNSYVEINPLRNLLHREHFVDSLFPAANVYHGGGLLNVRSLMREKRSDLARAYDLNVHAAEMEVYSVAPEVQHINHIHPHLKIGFAFAGVVSDVPLRIGDNRSQECDLRVSYTTLLGAIKAQILHSFPR